MAAQVIRFKDFVDGGPVPLDNFVASTLPAPDAVALRDGEVLVDLLYLSVDPYMRGRMAHQRPDYYFGTFTPGEPLASGCIAIVRASRNEGWHEGDVVSGSMPWVTSQVLDRKALAGVQLVPKQLLGKVPLSYFLGALGMPGLTAYAGLKKIAEPKQGEVALVSAAAGAVGLLVGQLLKHHYGCRVIGSAGSDDKVGLLREVGFDVAVNYKHAPKATWLAEACPDGLDIYWENVGGPVLEAVLDVARPHARIVACGMISQYELRDQDKYGVKNLFQVVTKRIKLQGMIVSDYAAELGAEFAGVMGRLVQEGKVHVREHITQGIESAGAAFVDMMSGKNTGKAVVRVCAEDPFPVQTPKP